MLQALLTRLLRASMRLLVKPLMGPPLPVHFQRVWIRAVSAAIPASTEPEVEPVGELEPGGIANFRIGVGVDDPANRPAILWAHGGGFTLGDHRTHAGLAGHIATAAGADVYLPEYRLAPEHPFPAATDDLFAAWRSMLARGHDLARVALGGDSAGGGLAVLTALALQEMSVPGPRALVLVSPWIDLSISGESARSRQRADPMLRVDWLADCARAFAGPRKLTDPDLSPLFAELAGLPPTLIQVGEDEILLDDSLRLADRAWGAGVEVELQRFVGLWHDFQMHARLHHGAAGAVGDIGNFLNRRWAS